MSAENDDNWFWFNQHLRIVIQQHAPDFLVPRTLTFVSDRQKGLLESVALNFPDSPHGYCLRHLYENMYKEFKHPQLKTFLWQAAEATTEEDYNAAMSGLKQISERAHTWLLTHAHPKYWAELYFEGRRYGHTTSNIAESLNAAILEAREKPVLGMFEHIRYQLMDWFAKRREIDLNAPQKQISVSSALKKIQELTAWQARRYRILACSDTETEVFSLERSITYMVNISSRSCTCYQWQSTGIPCSHAIAAILGHREDPQAYVESFLTLDSYRKTYSNAIHPPNADENEMRLSTDPLPPLQGEDGAETAECEDNALLPPPARRAPGRPQKQRIRSGVEGPFGGKRVKRCSRCGGLGHTKTTCNATI